MTKNDIIQAWVTMRKTNQTIPDDVLDLMKDSAIEYLENSAKKSVERINIVLAHKFKNIAKENIGKKMSDIPEMVQIVNAIDVIEKHCL